MAIVFDADSEILAHRASNGDLTILAVIDKDVDPETYDLLVQHAPLANQAVGRNADGRATITFPGGIVREIVGRDNLPKFIRGLKAIGVLFPEWGPRKQVLLLRVIRDLARHL